MKCHTNCNYATQQRRVRLTDSEKQNADKFYGGNLYTVVNRPGSKYGQSRLVAAVYLDGRIIQSRFVSSKEGVKDAIADILNTMDSCPQGGPMADASRHRPENKPDKKALLDAIRAEMVEQERLMNRPEIRRGSAAYNLASHRRELLSEVLNEYE
jgi:hypothetical protein